MSGAIHDLLNMHRAEGQPDSGALWHAVVAETITSETGTMTVVIPEFHPIIQWAPVRWQPRLAPLSETDSAGVTAIGAATTVAALRTAVLAALELTQLFPQRGDLALIMFSNRMDLWCPVWWPLGYDG